MGDEDMTYDSASRDVLLSVAKLIGEKCVDVNLAFTKCKAEHADPEACLKQGQAVLECNNKVFQTINTKCAEEFETYRRCMDDSQMNFGLCRAKEKAFRDAFYD